MDETGVNKTEPMSVEDVRGWYEAKVEEQRYELLQRPRVRRVGVLLAEIDRLRRRFEALPVDGVVAEVMDETLAAGGWPTGSTWKDRLSIIEQLLVRAGPKDPECATSEFPRGPITYPTPEPVSARCPDDGTCHHGCGAEGPCWRVFHAGPLSGVYPGDGWPLQITMAHRYEQSMQVPGHKLPEVGSTWENQYGKPYRWVEVVEVDRPWLVLRDVVDTDQPEHRWRTNIGAFLDGWIECGHPEEGCTAEEGFLTDRPVFTEEMIDRARQEVPFWPNPLRWLRHEMLVWRIAFNPDLPNDGMVLGRLVLGTCRQAGGSPVVDDAHAGDGGVGVAIRRRQRGDRGLLVPNPEAGPSNALVVAWKVGPRLAPLWLSPGRAKSTWLLRIYRTRLGGWLAHRWYRDSGLPFGDLRRPEGEVQGATPLAEWHDELADWEDVEPAHGLTFTEWLRAAGHDYTEAQGMFADVVDAAYRSVRGRAAGQTWITTRLVEWLREVEPFAVQQATTPVHHPGEVGGVEAAPPSVLKGVATVEVGVDPAGPGIAVVVDGRHERGHHRTAAEEAAVRSFADRQGDLR